MMIAPIAVSCGEPAGIGPEIAAKAHLALNQKIPFFWVGDPRHLPGGTAYYEISEPAAFRADDTRLAVLTHEFPSALRPGTPHPSNAQAVIDVIARAQALVASGAASALCTAPIHKAALIEGAQFAYPGHTEYLAALCNARRAVMMLAAPELRVVPTTIHIALSDVPNALSPELLRETVDITHDALITQFGVPSPRLAIAGLNPHAGEDGQFGQEEIEWITPLIAQMQLEGYELMGPLSADTMFHAKARKHFDAAICMYHDQALIPIKTLDFDRGVNVTLGLGLIRTSPDHGTAFDLAGRNQANPSSMIEALKLAAEMAQAQSKSRDGQPNGTN